MAVRRPGLERQLQAARHNLDLLTGTLEAGGVSAEARPSHPRWRNLHARRLRLERRLRSADALTSLNEELQRRKAERAAAKDAPAPEPEPAKPAKAGKKPAGKKPKGKKSE